MCMMVFEVTATLLSRPADETTAVTNTISSKNKTKKDNITPTMEAKTNLKNSFILGTNVLSMQVYKFIDLVISYLLQEGYKITCISHIYY